VGFSKRVRVAVQNIRASKRGNLKTLFVNYVSSSEAIPNLTGSVYTLLFWLLCASISYTLHVSILGFNAKAQGREEAQGNHFLVLLCELCVSAALR
jgi:hypothetical protein